MPDAPIRVLRHRGSPAYTLLDGRAYDGTPRYCGRPGMFGNPYAYRTREGLARVPAADLVTPWEYEGRCSAHGAQHDMVWPSGEVTKHTVRYMTRQEIVAVHRRALIAPSKGLRLYHRRTRQYVDVALVRHELAGRDLACWCGAGDACHVDTLLWVANAPADEIKLAAEAEYEIIRASAERVAQLHPEVMISRD